MNRIASYLIVACLLGHPACDRPAPPAPPDAPPPSGDPAAASPAASAPAAADVDAPPLSSFPAATVFAQSCSRCHGPQGAYYAVPFKHDGDELRQIIRVMMVGPGGLDPTDVQVQEMLDYHLAIRRHRLEAQ